MVLLKLLVLSVFVKKNICKGMKSTHSAIGTILLLMLVHVKPGVSQNYKAEHKSTKKHGKLGSDLLTKIHLTQKGYIQFLRYIKDVPLLTEYTFCLWMKSYNLTYSHPLLSYSKHEEERRIRFWISPRGRAINLEINDVGVFSIPMEFREHHWYHICQSWSSEHALWELFVNGKKKIRGYEPKLFGVPIKSGGDIVIGQEYTDFDKGLEDGIEGDIFGFNFVLSATSTGDTEHYTNLPNSLTRRPTFFYNGIGFRYKKPTSRKVPPIHSDPEILWFKNKFVILPSEFNPSRKTITGENSEIMNFHPKKGFQFYRDISDSFLLENYRGINHRSLGNRLVELSGNCSLGKGAPLDGKKVLINWTKTTVRVFGGAIVKHVKPFC